MKRTKQVKILNTPAAKREALAQRVITAVSSISCKLSELEADIRALWVEFENLPKGETILDCSTKKEFCEKHLHRTPRAVRYMLDGGNDAYVPVGQGETISPASAPAVEPTQLTKPKQVHVSGDEDASPFWKTLFHKLNALMPTYSDGVEHAMVTMLDEAYGEPLGEDGADFLKSIVPMLEKISADYAERALKLKTRMKFDDLAEIVQVEEQMAPPSDGVSITTFPLQSEKGASC